MSKKTKQQQPKAPPQKAQSFGRWFCGRLLSIVAANSRLAIVVAGICTCVWFIADAFKAYAGKTSTADIKFGILADIRVVWTVSMAVGITGLALYRREVRLHRSTRERLAARITEMELRVDPARRSSKLTTQGMTREDDK